MQVDSIPIDLTRIDSDLQSSCRSYVTYLQ